MNNTFEIAGQNQHHTLTGWHWYLNGHNGVNLGIIKMKQKLKCEKIVIAMLLQQPSFSFTLSFQDRLMPNLVALLDDCSNVNVNLAAE